MDAVFWSIKRYLFDQREVSNNCCKYDGNHGEQFDQNVDSWTGCILEWVTNGIANNSCFMVVRTFAAVVASFDVS